MLKELLKKIEDYKPLAKVEELTEQNYNNVDNVFNNTLPLYLKQSMRT